MAAAPTPRRTPALTCAGGIGGDAPSDVPRSVDAPVDAPVDTPLETPPGPPAVLWTIPSHEANNVALSPLFVAQFTEPMLPWTVQLVVAPPKQYLAPMFNPTSEIAYDALMRPLLPSTTYTLTIMGEDTSMMPLVGDNTFTFTTGGPPDTRYPTITLTPAPDEKDVPTIGASVSARFSEPVNPFSGNISIERVPLDLVWNQEFTVATAQLPELWPSFTFDISAAAADIAGNLGSSLTTQFMTGPRPVDNVRPTVATTIPDNDARDVSTNSLIIVFFSEAMNTDVTGRAISMNGKPCLQVLWDLVGTRGACFVPVAVLPGMTYTVTVADTAADRAGNTLAAAHTFTFSTAAVPDKTAPRVVNVSPADGETAVPRDSEVTINFSEPMHADLTETAISIRSDAPGFTEGTRFETFRWTNGGRTLIWKPAFPMPYGADVTIGVGTAFDASLNMMAMGEGHLSTFKVLRLVERTLDAEPELDGDVDSAGAVSNGSMTFMVGDRASNDHVFGFLSFDLGGLNVPLPMHPATRIVSAQLQAEQISTNGTPYLATTPTMADNLGALRAEHASYGPMLGREALISPTLENRVYPLVAGPSAGIKFGSVTAAVADDWSRRGERNNRSQFRLRFTGTTSENGTADFARFVSGDNTIMPKARPKLIVRYETP